MDEKRNRERERKKERRERRTRRDSRRDARLEGKKGSPCKGKRNPGGGESSRWISVGNEKGGREGDGRSERGEKGGGEAQRGERSGKGDERYRGEKEGSDARERYRAKAAVPSALVQEAAAAREETSRPASVSGMLGAAIVILPPFHRAPITQSISLGCCPSVRPSLPFLSD